MFSSKNRDILNDIFLIIQNILFFAFTDIFFISHVSEIQ